MVERRVCVQRTRTPPPSYALPVTPPPSPPRVLLTPLPSSLPTGCAAVAPWRRGCRCRRCRHDPEPNHGAPAPSLLRLLLLAFILLLIQPWVCPNITGLKGVGLRGRVFDDFVPASASSFGAHGKDGAPWPLSLQELQLHLQNIRILGTHRKVFCRSPREAQTLCRAKLCLPGEFGRWAVLRPCPTSQTQKLIRKIIQVRPGGTGSGRLPPPLRPLHLPCLLGGGGSGSQRSLFHYGNLYDGCAGGASDRLEVAPNAAANSHAVGGLDRRRGGRGERRDLLPRQRQATARLPLPEVVCAHVTQRRCPASRTAAV